MFKQKDILGSSTQNYTVLKVLADQFTILFESNKFEGEHT